MTQTVQYPITAVGTTGSPYPPLPPGGITVAQAKDLIAEQAASDLGTYVPISSAKETITYDASGNVQTVTETTSGAVTTYTYNADGSPATESRVLNGVTTLRTFSYSGGNLVGIS